MQLDRHGRDGCRDCVEEASSCTQKRTACHESSELTPAISHLRDNFQLALDVFSEQVQQKLGSRTLRRIVAAARHVLS